MGNCLGVSPKASKAVRKGEYAPAPEEMRAADKNLSSTVDSPVNIGPVFEQPGSPLLQLPGELRSAIYEYALDCHIVQIQPLVPPLDWKDTKYPVYRHEPGRHPLRQVCGQTYKETAAFTVDDVVLDFRNAEYADDTVLGELWWPHTIYVPCIVLIGHQVLQWDRHRNMYSEWFISLYHVEVVDCDGACAKYGYTAEYIAESLASHFLRPKLEVDIVDFSTYPNALDREKKVSRRCRKLDTGHHPEDGYSPQSHRFDWR